MAPNVSQCGTHAANVKYDGGREMGDTSQALYLTFTFVKLRCIKLLRLACRRERDTLYRYIWLHWMLVSRLAGLQAAPRLCNIYISHLVHITSPPPLDRLVRVYLSSHLTRPDSLRNTVITRVLCSSLFYSTFISFVLTLNLVYMIDNCTPIIVTFYNSTFKIQHHL